MQEPENEDSYEYSSLLWYHPDCLKKVIVSVFKMKNVKAEDFVGYKNLKSADKKKVREMLGETEEADKTSSDSGKGFVIIEVYIITCRILYVERSGKVTVQVDQLIRNRSKRTLKKWLSK